MPGVRHLPANRLPFQIEKTILGIKKEHPTWGARKIRDKLLRQYTMIKPPAVSTTHAVLDRNGLVKRKKRRRHKAQGTPLIGADAPNGLWCADYKGEFMLGNREYCYPLTISDYKSRYLLTCEGVASTRSDFAFSIFERAFKDFGHHERMHLTLKHEATKPAAFNFLQQQERFDHFIEVYNNERPHQALGGAYPGDIYTPSPRAYETPGEPEYPFHDRTKLVTRCGRICLGRRKINLSSVFAGQLVGIREVDNDIWQVSFLEYDLGYFDKERDRVEPGPSPFAPDKVLTMCPE